LRETEVEIDPERIELLRRVMPRPVSDARARSAHPWRAQTARLVDSSRNTWAIATSSRMETAAVNLAALDVDPVQIPCHHARSG
jgi:hypothetical protein